MSERQVFRRPRARADVLDIFEYIATENPGAAYRFIAAVRETEEMLLAMPHMAAASSFGLQRFPDMRHRSVKGFENYLIFYQPIEAGVDVVRVLHGARDLERLFG